MKQRPVTIISQGQAFAVANKAPRKVNLLTGLTLLFNGLQNGYMTIRSMASTIGLNDELSLQFINVLGTTASKRD